MARLLLYRAYILIISKTWACAGHQRRCRQGIGEGRTGDQDLHEDSKILMVGLQHVATNDVDQQRRCGDAEKLERDYGRL